MAQISTVFEAALEDAHIWLKEVADGLGLDDRRVAVHVMRAVLHPLRDRLPLELTAHLSAQLPLMIRGLFFENWNPHAKPNHHRLDDFTDALERELRGVDQAIELTDAMRVVFAVLGTHVSLGEWRKIGAVLPREVADLWFDSGA